MPCVHWLVASPRPRRHTRSRAPGSTRCTPCRGAVRRARAMMSATGMDRAPAMCPAAYSCSGRTSSNTIFAVVHAPRQLVRRYGLEAVTITEKVAYDAVHLGEVLSRRCAAAPAPDSTTSGPPAGSGRTDPRGGPQTSCACRSCCRCREVFATDRPVSAASDSTVRSPWASTSRISNRCGLAIALPMRANSP